MNPNQGNGWSLLPEELGDRILSRLPKKDIASRVRPVCKEWKEKTSSSSSLFWSLHMQFHPLPKDSWILLFNKDSWLRHVCKLSSQFSWHVLDSPPPPTAHEVLDWVAASSGAHMMCIHCHGEEGFFVGNPLLGANWDHIFPPMEESVHSQPILWALLDDGHSHTSTEMKKKGEYSVVLLHAASAKVCVFNSEKEEWSRDPLPQQICTDRSSISLSAVSIENRVFLIDGKNRSLHSYHLSNHRWHHYPPSLLPHQLLLGSSIASPTHDDDYFLHMPPKIVEGPQGRLLLVGAQMQQQQQQQQQHDDDPIAPTYNVCVCVWELLPPTMVAPLSFKEVSRMPHDMWMEMIHDAKESREPSCIPIHFSGQTSLVLVSSIACHHCIAYSVHQDKWFAIDFPSTYHASNNLDLCLLGP